MPILLNNLQEKKRILDGQLKLMENILNYGIDLHQKPNAEVSVVLVDDDYIRKLNAQYRKMDRPTDVLSFPVGDDLTGLPIEILGDIYLSVERALEQSAEYGHSFERELCYLAVHGLLHLLGFDHHSDPDTEVMRREEEKIMEKFALGRNSGLEDQIPD